MCSGILMACSMNVYMHVHAVSSFQRSFLINGSIAELGLDRPEYGLQNTSGCEPVRTTDTGFPNNTALLDDIMRNCPGCFSMSSQLLCEATPGTVETEVTEVLEEQIRLKKYNRSLSDRPKATASETKAVV